MQIFWYSFDYLFVRSYKNFIILAKTEIKTVKIQKIWDNQQGRLTKMNKKHKEEPSETIRLEALEIAMNIDAQWVVGFTDGEGCFHIGLNKNSGMTLGIQVLPEFTVVQHERDIVLLYALKEFFKTGSVDPNHGDRKAFRIRGYNSINKYVIPFFEKHKLKSKKRIDFEKFRDVILLMGKQEHLTREGLSKINKIANQMNRKALQNELQKVSEASHNLATRIEIYD